MAGWAGSVIGAKLRTEDGRVLELGNKMGETKGGQRIREMSARLSTMSYALGHIN